MTDLLLHIVFCHLVIVGVHTITRDGFIFGFVEYFWEHSRVPRLGDPFTECTTCMASVWGVGYYILFVQDGGPLLHAAPAIAAFCLALAGFDTFTTLLWPMKDH